MIKYCNVTKALIKKCIYISDTSSACFAPDGYVCKLEQQDLRNAEKWFAEQRKRAETLQPLIDLL